MSVRPRLTMHLGEGRKRREELDSRDAVARLLLETGLDLLRRKASTERSAWIGRQADEVLWLFENAPRNPALQQVLERKLDELEALVRELRSEP